MHPVFDSLVSLNLVLRIKTKVSSTTVQLPYREKYYLFTLFCIIGRPPFKRSCIPLLSLQHRVSLCIFSFFFCCMSSGSFLNMALFSAENCIKAFEWKQWKAGRSPDSLYSLCCKKVTLSFYPQPGCISWQIYDRLDSSHHLFQIIEQVAMTLGNNGDAIRARRLKAFCSLSVFALEAKLLGRKRVGFIFTCPSCC